MKRTITISRGIISGYDKDIIVNILPELLNSFRQRKKFYEYYFDPIEIEITLEELDKLSSEFIIKLYYDELIIDF